jgi:hypothetical protein
MVGRNVGYDSEIRLRTGLKNLNQGVVFWLSRCFFIGCCIDNVDRQGWYEAAKWPATLDVLQRNRVLLVPDARVRTK